MLGRWRGGAVTGFGLAGLLLAGCGTTVTGVSGVAGPGGGSSAQGLAVPGGSVGASSAAPGAGLAVPSGASGQVGPAARPVPSGGTVPAAAPTDRTGPVGGGQLSVPGVTPTTIMVGVPYAVNGAAANQAIGGNGITQGDEKGESQAVIDDINRHGGVLGRKLVPVWHAVDALSDDTTDSQYQAMCADFEQDHHVFAIFEGGSPIIEQCAQQAGGVAVYDNLSVSSARTFTQFPSYFEVSMMDLDRIVLNEAIALGAEGYFAPWDSNLGRPATAPGAKSKVGILTYDTADFHHAIDSDLKPELARLGYPVANSDVIYVSEPQRTSDIGQLSAQEANAIVRFRHDGVEHVLIVDVTGLLTLEFLNDAESQHYHPRYGWSSQNGPQALAGPGDVPKDQMTGSMGMGFIPMQDLPQAADPDNGPYSNSARRSCLKLLRSKGFTFSDNNAEVVALLICAQFHFFAAALEAGGATISQADFIDGANKLRSSFQGADTFTEVVAPGQHDTAGSYRYYQWDTGCGCMRYTSGLKTAIGEAEG